MITTSKIEPTYLETEHFFYYDAKNPMTASSLADALLGFESIVKRSTVILNQLLESNIKDAEVLVKNIEYGSYKENLAFRFFFGAGKIGEKNLEKLRTQLHLQDMDLKKVASIVIILVIFYVAYRCLPVNSASSNTSSTTNIQIENSFNNLGGQLGLSRDQVIKLMEDSIKNPEELKKQVSKIAHPGGIEHGGSMTLDSDESLRVPADVVSVIPPGYKKDHADEPFKDFEKVGIVIRAIDLDRPKTGWAGILPEIWDHRVPVILADDLNPATVPAGKLTLADVTIIYKVDRYGDKKPKKILLRKIHSVGK
jgi:hypothetical protein